MQRPLRSQSPKRVGSGPEGPPVSGRRPAGFTSALAAEIARESSSEDGTEGGVAEFFSGLIGISHKCARIGPWRPRDHGQPLRVW